MKTDWRIEGPQIAVLVTMFAAAGLTWGSAPDRIPVHWNAAGEIDRYGGKVEGLLALPLIALAQYLLLRFLPMVDPGRANYASFRGAFDVVRIAVLGLLAVVYAILHVYLRGGRMDMNVVIPLLIGGLFIVLGNVQGKLRPNWFMGIRTPWTMSSAHTWTRTHRMGGWLMVALGLATTIGGVAMGARVIPLVMMPGLVAYAVWSMAYSYWVWRTAPDKVDPAGTTPAADR